MPDSPQPRLSRGQARLLKLALVSASLLLSLLLGEVACRLFVGNPPDLLDKSDPVFGSRYRRGAVATRIVDGQQVPVRINSDGFNSPELPRERTPGTARLLFLGDSFTAATEVPPEENFTQRAAADLSEPDRPVEAVNLGISGFNTAQELLCWRTVGLEYQPDVVILALFAGNDLSDNVPELAATNIPNFGLRPDGSLTALPFTPRWSKKPNWLRDSALYKWQKQVTNRAVRKAQESQQILPRYGAYQAPTTEVWKRAWAVTEAMLLALRDDTQAAGATLVVLLIPEQMQVDPAEWAANLATHPRMNEQTWNLDYPYARLTAFGKANAIEVIDATRPFKTAMAHQPLYNVEDFHCNRAGHRLLARLVAERIDAAGLLPAKDDPATAKTGNSEPSE